MRHIYSLYETNKILLTEGESFLLRNVWFFKDNILYYFDHAHLRKSSFDSHTLERKMRNTQLMLYSIYDIRTTVWERYCAVY